VPGLAIRSTFIVGFPGETEADFQYLLDWLEQAQIDRAGCFKYEAVEGAQANALPGAVPEDVKEERWHRFMAHQSRISEARLRQKIGRTLDVLIDEVDDEGGASGRSKYDAPEIDGMVHLRDCSGVKPGDIISVLIEDADEADLFGVPV
jgi:ribosomal protein S12 methylthiotransferase